MRSRPCVSAVFPVRFPHSVAIDTIGDGFRQGPPFTHPPQREKGSIRVCVKHSGPFALVKLSGRKNMVGGFILKLPGFCALENSLAPSTSPAQAHCPAVSARSRPGDPLSRKTDSRDVNRTRRAVVRTLRVPDWERYSSHGFRRGAAHETNDTGAPWEVVSAHGMRDSPSFRGYVALAADVGDGVRNLFLGGPAYGSSGDPAGYLPVLWVFGGGGISFVRNPPLFPWVEGFSGMSLSNYQHHLSWTGYILRIYPKYIRLR